MPSDLLPIPGPQESCETTSDLWQQLQDKEREADDQAAALAEQLVAAQQQLGGQQGPDIGAVAAAGLQPAAAAAAAAASSSGAADGEGLSTVQLAFTLAAREQEISRLKQRLGTMKQLFSTWRTRTPSPAASLRASAAMLGVGGALSSDGSDGSSRPTSAGQPSGSHSQAPAASDISSHRVAAGAGDVAIIWRQSAVFDSSRAATPACGRGAELYAPGMLGDDAASASTPRLGSAPTRQEAAEPAPIAATPGVDQAPGSSGSSAGSSKRSATLAPAAGQRPSRDASTATSSSNSRHQADSPDVWGSARRRGTAGLAAAGGACSQQQQQPLAAVPSIEDLQQLRRSLRHSMQSIAAAGPPEWGLQALQDDNELLLQQVQVRGQQHCCSLAPHATPPKRPGLRSRRQQPP
jgi:hypothetical protein